MTASLCAPETRWIATRGHARTSHTARRSSTPVCRVRKGSATAISTTPSTDTSRSAARAPASDPPTVAAAAARSRNTGPYGAGASRHVGDTASSHGQPSAATPAAYGSCPAARACP
jgi:hypothetical protein